MKCAPVLSWLIFNCAFPYNTYFLPQQKQAATREQRASLVRMEELEIYLHVTVA